MIRFFHNGYSCDELRRLKLSILQLQHDLPCDSTDCEECELRHICSDLGQFAKRLEYLEECERHIGAY